MTSRNWTVGQTFTSIEELKAFMNTARKKIAENDNAYYDAKGNIQFKLRTKFRWGRHEGNKLIDVYKVEPTYVEWCIRTCSGFGIFEEDLQLLKATPVFDIDELNGMCKPEGSDNRFYIDLLSVPRDANGFLTSNTIREHPYSFNQETLNENKRKIIRGLDFNNYQFGIPDNNNLQLKNILLRRHAIKINLKVMN